VKLKFASFSLPIRQGEGGGGGCVLPLRVRFLSVA